MKESDWKAFTIIKDAALEKYCETVLSDSEALICDKEQLAHTRYVSLYQLLKVKDKELGQLFDGHSRARASAQLLFIRKAGLLDESQLMNLSEEFREETNLSKLSYLDN